MQCRVEGAGALDGGVPPCCLGEEPVVGGVLPGDRPEAVEHGRESDVPFIPDAGLLGQQGVEGPRDLLWPFGLVLAAPEEAGQLGHPQGREGLQEGGFRVAGPGS